MKLALLSCWRCTSIGGRRPSRSSPENTTRRSISLRQVSTPRAADPIKTTVARSLSPASPEKPIPVFLPSRVHLIIRRDEECCYFLNECLQFDDKIFQVNFKQFQAGISVLNVLSQFVQPFQFIADVPPHLAVLVQLARNCYLVVVQFSPSDTQRFCRSYYAVLVGIERPCDRCPVIFRRPGSITNPFTLLACSVQSVLRFLESHCGRLPSRRFVG